jgi:phosphotransferase system  glucose/maltose/N-acetylglucosamine-specific IIC component
MSEHSIDLIGEIFWYLLFITPLITFPIVFKLSKGNNIYKIIIGILLALVLSVVFYFISLSILFRSGLGPS